MTENSIINALLGVATGDALGVPFEFKSRQEMQENPAREMVGYGTHYQAPGTWSDDSSLTFCLAESLTRGYDLKDISEQFIRWKKEAYWTARGDVFDIGMTTSRAISRLETILDSGDLSGLKEQKFYGHELDNGNGSLMRIIPLLFYIKGLPIKKQFDIIWEVSALTHRHIRAAMSCLIYLRMAEKLLSGQTKEDAYTKTRLEILNFWEEIAFAAEEREHFKKVIQQDIRNTPIEDLRTGGYVIEVLESGIYFFLENSNYRDTVLSIINLGHDTDTSAAIAGGLAGIYYGKTGIPATWLNALARVDEIIDLGERLSSSMNSGSAKS